jgi:5-methyltetrahydrofolate--homocysteine methyltransferase
MDRRGADIQRLLAEALASMTADTLLTEVVLPAMRSVIEAHLAGRLILPDVLESAEVVHQALDSLRPAAPFRKGSVVLATLAGDVHHVGKALLVTIWSACGYTVHDLGSQVSVESIVDAAIDLQPDAIGLSALLVTTSKQMPVCIQRLDARGVHVPVLIGGAAISRGFGRRSAMLPDGRQYEPGVFYCKDVFEGLATLDALVDPSRRAELIARTREEVTAALTVQPLRPGPRQAGPENAGRPGSRGPRVDVVVPRPPYWGVRRVEADLRDVWRSLDRNTLFRYHWGGYRVAPEDFQRLVRDVFEPKLAELSDDALQGGWLRPLIVSGYFPCNADGNSLLLFDPDDDMRQVLRLNFPRQPDGERLCLADYFRPLGTRQRDVVPLQAVTTGRGAGELIDELQRAGEYARMAYASGLAAATAEALAEHAHQLARRDLRLGSDQGLRFSWGYPACPDLEEQRKVLPLLHADELVGLTLSPSSNLDPEHSTAAIILHHPEAKYFAVRGDAA